MLKIKKIRYNIIHRSDNFKIIKHNVTTNKANSMFKKFKDICTIKFGNPSNKEKLAIYSRQLEDLKENLLVSINENRYDKNHIR